MEAGKEEEMGQQRRLLSTWTTQKTWTDEESESPEKVGYKRKREDGCRSERGWRREGDEQEERRKSMERRNGGGNCLADMNG